VQTLRKRPRGRWPIALLVVASSLVFGTGGASGLPGETVVMQGLDKVTARVSTFEIPIGHSVRFGTLQIYARGCDRTPPEDPPESAAFLEIFEMKPGERRNALFQGWMFASSPALSALEHPVYDVWVLECIPAATPATSP